MLTERLELIAATLELCQAELLGPVAVNQLFVARLPSAWPPPVFELDDVERVRQSVPISFY